MKRLQLAATLLVCVLTGAATGCHGAPALDDAPQYTLVFLHGATPAPVLSPEEVEEAMAGHFANMAVLAEQGRLLVAGPLGPPRSEASHRGIFVLDTGELDRARAWTGTDPSIGAGIFVPELLPCRSRSPLERIVPLDNAAMERRMREDPAVTRETAWQGRAYVIASAPDDAEHEARAGTLAASGAALITLEVERPEGSELWLVLDAQDVDAARALLGPDAATWTLHGWYATAVLPELVDGRG